MTDVRRGTPLGECPLRSTAFAVVDLETTGFHAESDRVVEIAVRRFNPADGSVETFDSLVHPERAMGSTQLHGIGQRHIEDAPRFRDLAPTLLGFLSNAVLASYNVDYDAHFLGAELRRQGVDVQLPQLCLMWLKPMLGLGPRCSLPDACSELGVPFDGKHQLAAGEAAAAQGLLERYLRECDRFGLVTFGHLRAHGASQWPDPWKRPRFLGTLHHPLLPDLPPPECRTASRRDWPVEELMSPDAAKLKTYFDALVGVLADAAVTEEELQHLEALQRRLGLTTEQAGALHARAYLCMAMNYIGDDWLDPNELERLDHISRSLGRLGWAPGAGAA